MVIVAQHLTGLLSFRISSATGKIYKMYFKLSMSQFRIQSLFSQVVKFLNCLVAFSLTVEYRYSRSSNYQHNLKCIFY